MVTERAAIAFARWREAHKLYVEAQRRLDAAERLSSQFGGLPPQYLVDHVRFVKREADRLLEIALAESSRK
jgi:hypothetical protein